MSPDEALEQLDLALGRVRRMWEHPGVRQWITARIDLDDVDASIFRTLRAANQLGPKDASVNGIASLLRIDASTASRFLERTRAKGFVERSASPTDRRRWLFSLTADGREQLRLLRERRIELLDQVTTDWSADDLESLIDLLGRFDEALIGFGRADDS
jgi:DNA-binding MarR family transcriptional regulator